MVGKFRGEVKVNVIDSEEGIGPEDICSAGLLDRYDAFQCAGGWWVGLVRCTPKGGGGEEVVITASSLSGTPRGGGVY